MNRLQTELRRLYLPSNPIAKGTNFEEFALINHEGGVRAMVLEVARPADWNAVSALWQGVQADLKLPAPAIAVSGIDGYQLWFSLMEPVPLVEANSFLESLRLRYLSTIGPGRIDMKPSVNALLTDPAQHARMVPALWKKSGRWSAFIAPDLAALFSDEPWLDMCPSSDAQADVLSRMVSIKAANFQMVLGQLDAAAKTATSYGTLATSEKRDSNGGVEHTVVAYPRTGLDPKGFLLNVMDDKTIELHLRIQAAQALLPYF